MGWRPWRAAWHEALYGPAGFYLREQPADHFRTSANGSAVFAGAVRRLAGRVDDLLGRPDPFDVVDLGAGRAELLQALPDVPARWRLTAVELRPGAGAPRVQWRSDIPPVTGLLVAHEWLDDVPLDIVQGGRTVLVDGSGQERPGPAAPAEQRRWAGRWWPRGDRVEVGLPRDRAWAAATARVDRGLAVAVDYAHVLGPSVTAPLLPGRRATLTGYRDGRQVRPVPDGSCDLTAHLAADAVAAATGSRLLDQRTALRRLGVDAGLPVWSGDAPGYAAALQQATSAATLLDRAGAGGFAWLVRPVGIADPLAARIGT